jgi:hypothetical protein
VEKDRRSLVASARAGATFFSCWRDEDDDDDGDDENEDEDEDDERERWPGGGRAGKDRSRGGA